MREALVSSCVMSAIRVIRAVCNWVNTFMTAP
jgi:hypothetical protein